MRTIHIYDDFSICYFTVSEHWSETEISEIPACAGMTDNKKKLCATPCFLCELWAL